MSVKNMFLETRPQFLLLSPILSFLGMAIALYNGSFNTLYFVLAAIGLLLLRRIRLSAGRAFKTIHGP
jgi:hypothetical protein